MSSSTLQDRFRYYFTLRAERVSFAVIFASVFCYFVWWVSFPLFGPVMGNFLGGLRALAIEKGRVVQVFLLSMLVSSFISGFVIDRVLKRVVFVWVSALLASLATYVFLFINDILVLYPLVVVLGLLAGVSPVAIGAFFADHTSPEDRGRIMGVALAFAMPVAYLFLIFSPVGGAFKNDFLVVGTVFLFTLVTVLLKPKDKTEEVKKARRRGGLGAKQTGFYAGPIFLFHIVAGVLLSIVFPTIQDNVSRGLFYMTWAIPFFLGAIIGGALLDTNGRKFPMIVGLAITGVSLAVLGIIGIKLGFVAIISLAVGYAICTVSSFVVWADLAPVQRRGLYYGVGFGLISGALLLGSILVGSQFGSVSATRVNWYLLFSSVAIFLGIPPLIQVEDALPREVIEKRQMEEHLRRARERMRKK